MLLMLSHAPDAARQAGMQPLTCLGDTGVPRQKPSIRSNLFISDLMLCCNAYKRLQLLSCIAGTHLEACTLTKLYQHWILQALHHFYGLRPLCVSNYQHMVPMLSLFLLTQMYAMHIATPVGCSVSILQSA